VRVLLIGGSGFVGRALVARLGAHEGLQLDLLLRRSLSTDAANTQMFTGDPLVDALQQWREAERSCDVLVSALGTTRRIAGSIDAFAKIDRDLVLDVACAARAAGARQAVLVSSVGADPRSRNDYLRIKGELEQAVAGLGYQRCDVLQPGLLLGARGEVASRPAERLGQWVAPLLNPLMSGGFARFRAIEARRVARAAHALIGRLDPGVHAHRWAELMVLSAVHSAAD
jgi:uncharacterized protein YbjT (DUF2867 family)